jgi:hypothetical protein
VSSTRLGNMRMFLITGIASMVKVTWFLLMIIMMMSRNNWSGASAAS